MDSSKLGGDRASGLTLLIIIVTYKNSLLLLIFPAREVFVFVAYGDIQCSSNPLKKYHPFLPHDALWVRVRVTYCNGYMHTVTAICNMTKK